jgi:hypothetical protein
MDWFDRHILQYVLWWAPSGEMYDEDVFPEFGMGVEQLNERFTRIVAKLASCDDDLDAVDRDLLSRARRHQLFGLTAPEADPQTNDDLRR